MAAAVAATETGHHATVFEAARAVGGRARALNGTLPDGTEVTLDNGQHILIGAYADTLALMASPHCCAQILRAWAIAVALKPGLASA